MSKKAGLICAAVACAAVLCTMPISLQRSALVRHKPIMVTIDASLDELTGATIIITTTTDDRLCTARSHLG